MDMVFIKWLWMCLGKKNRQGNDCIMKSLLFCYPHWTDSLFLNKKTKQKKQQQIIRVLCVCISELNSYVWGVWGAKTSGEIQKHISLCQVSNRAKCLLASVQIRVPDILSTDQTDVFLKALSELFKWLLQRRLWTQGSANKTIIPQTRHQGQPESHRVTQTMTAGWLQLKEN